MTDPGGRPAAEWTLFGIAAAVLLAIVVSVAVLAVRGNDADPTFRVSIEPATRRHGSWYVPVAVRNAGDATAADVQVSVTLERSGAEVAGGDQVVDFVSGGEEVRLTFVLREDPARGQLTAEVTGFQDP